MWKEREISHVHVMEGADYAAFDIIIKPGTTGGGFCRIKCLSCITNEDDF